MDGRSKTILVAEDHESNRAMLARLLKQAQYEVYPVADGYDALDRMHKGVIDAVITDREMPRVNGSEFLALSQVFWPGTPVIIVAAQASPSAEGIPGGAFAWPQKPYELPHLLQVLQATLDSSAPRRWEQPMTTT